LRAGRRLPRTNTAFSPPAARRPDFHEKLLDAAGSLVAERPGVVPLGRVTNGQATRSRYDSEQG